MTGCPACDGFFPGDGFPVCRCGSDWISPRKDIPMSETADFMKWREDWIRFIAVPNRHGNYDIAIVIDEGYGHLADAVRNIESYKQKLAAAMAADGLPLGVPLNPATLRPQVVETAVEELT